MRSQPLRLAIAGFGLVGRRQRDAINRVAGLELVGVADPDPGARAYATGQGLKWFPTLARMFVEARPDGVILATPTPMHVPQGLDCVARGVPVLVEKPIASRTSDAARLVEAAKGANARVLVGHHRRHNPLVRAAKEMIREGAIGDVRAVHASCWLYKPDDYFESAAWRRGAGGGPISINLSHDVDVLRHLCGEIVRVQAQAVPSTRGSDTEEAAAATMGFESGAVGTVAVADSIVAPWSWEMTAQENPAYPWTSQSCYLIGGSRGSLSIPDLTLWTQPGGRSWWKPISASRSPREAADPLVEQIRHFADVIAGAAEPLVSALEGLKTLRVVEAIQEAAATGETVRVHPQIRREPVVAAKP